MTTDTKITAREAKRLATRERLFAAAVAEFKRTGVVAGDVGAIVAEAGVAHGTFFFHFSTKEHVIAELGQREEVRMAESVRQFLAQRPTVRELLMEVIRLSALLERRTGPVLFKDVLGLYFSPNRPELQAWPDHPVIALVTERFEQARAEGDFPPGEIEPATAAVFFFLSLYSLLINFERNGERNIVLEQCVTVLLKGLGIE
jgi:AcrR family transcriptional regulator